jgi:hypothetical protein
MIRRLAQAVASIAVFLPWSGAAVAGDAQAPPTLTPFAARYVASGCPEAKPYADALVRGITLAEAKAATPVLTRCATAVRLFELRWKNDSAAFGLAAVQLSEGLLERDPALLKRAADATRRMRDFTPASDSQIRSWDVIPDTFYARYREAVVFDDPVCAGNLAVNAAYINLAARSGTAWIRTPRDVPAADKAGRCPINPPPLPAVSGFPGGVPYQNPDRPPAPPERPAPNAPPR